LIDLNRKGSNDMRHIGVIMLAALLPISAQAQDKPAPAAEMIEPTCADLMAALRVADPGKQPSTKRQAAAEEAQDDIATALFWLHGWHTARGTATLPVKRDWMVAELKRVVAACKTDSPDGKALVSQVATK
jgi:hypothetical protein